MKVAIDTNCILPGKVGGIENYTLALIETLKMPQSPVSELLLLTRQENQELFSRLVDGRTTTMLVKRPAGNWADLFERSASTGEKRLADYQLRKADALHQHHVDLLHCPGNTINPLNLQIPVVLNLHDLQHRHYPQYFTGGELENREKWWVCSAGRADALIAASAYVRDDLHQQLHISQDRIFVAPDPVESVFHQTPDETQLAGVRERLKLPGTFFLYPAAAWPHKNHKGLIEAFLAAKLSGAQLVLTGGGQEALADWSNHSSIRLLGRIDTSDLVGLYHLATAMIFPSRHESWSIPITEAMASGCPVACSNVTSLPQQISGAGLLFDPEEQEQITTAIRRLATDADLREILSRRGKCRVRQWSPSRFLKTVTAAYGFAMGAYSISRKAA